MARAIPDLWSALALDPDEAGVQTRQREDRLEEVKAVWGYMLVAQLLAPLAVIAAAWRTGDAALIRAAALCGGVVTLFAMLGLAVLALGACRAWEPHLRNRAMAVASFGMGLGLLSLLWVAADLREHASLIACFVSIFASITVTLAALHPLRAAMLAFTAAMVATIAFSSGLSAPTSMALLALVALAIATCRLSLFDARQGALRLSSDGHGQLAAQLIQEFENQGTGWFWQTDRHGCLTYLSEKIARGAEAQESAIGQRLGAIFVMESDPTETQRTIAFHLSSRTAFAEYSVRRADAPEGGNWLSISGRPIFDAVGRFKGFIGSGSDLTERRKSDAEITKLALSDGLTGLANRQRMRVVLERALASPQHGGQHAFALFLLDLDRFKAVNDTLGHQTGDTLLKQVAQRLIRAVGHGGLVGRIGGDEFQVMLPGAHDRDALADLAQTVIASLSQPYFIDGSSISIGCSIGIAIAPEQGGDSETLVRNADLALYDAKGDGRGIHRFYREELLLGAQSRKKLEDDLRQALQANQLHLAYQPVVSTVDAQIVGYEALLRWDHPERGAISPAQFIPIAEECGLIESIGEWALRTACAEAATWPESVRVAVNVSPVQFANPALPSIVMSAIAGARLAPARLELEITEGVFLNESASTDDMFKALKGIGVRLALDDFGTGYSSLGYLRKAPFDKIKIDQSFVRGVTMPDNRNAAIIKAIVTLATTLGMDTTAEGVELQDEADLIGVLGCSHIQGYFYGKPARSVDVLRQLSAGGHAAPLGHKVSRSPRATMLRSATLQLGDASGEVRIRNISTTGAMIDGVEFGRQPPENLDVLIELLEGRMFPATLRWASDGKAGLEFAEAFDLEHLTAAPARLRRQG